MEWDPRDWWRMQIKDPPLPKAFQWTNQRELWPIPPVFQTHNLHLILNKRWRILWDRRQWNFHLYALWSKYVEPKKACLAWLIMYRAIWTQKKALQFGIGNGKCARCGLEEDDIHIFLQCNSIAHLLAKIKGFIASGGKGSFSWKQLLLGETIECSIELWTVIKTKILWFFWIERLSAIFQGATRNSSSLQQCLVAVGERYYSKKHNLLSSRIDLLQTEDCSEVD